MISFDAAYAASERRDAAHDGALVLAVATAVIDATAAGSTSPPALLDGYRAGVLVSVVAAGLGLLVTVLGPLAERRRAPATACSAA
jgi:hypothetical protein